MEKLNIKLYEVCDCLGRFESYVVDFASSRLAKGTGTPVMGGRSVSGKLEHIVSEIKSEMKRDNITEYDLIPVEGDKPQKKKVLELSLSRFYVSLRHCLDWNVLMIY